jgi:hypothetical protein
MLPLSFDWPEAPTFTKIVRNNANRDKRVVGDGPTSRDAADKENRVAGAATAVELQRLRDCCQRAEAAAAAAEMDRKLSAEDAAAARAEAASLAQANVELRGRLAERDTEVERLKRQLASVTMELSKTSSIARYSESSRALRHVACLVLVERVHHCASSCWKMPAAVVGDCSARCAPRSHRKRSRSVSNSAELAVRPQAGARSWQRGGWRPLRIRVRAAGCC